MNREDIIRMARDAGIDDHESDWIFWNAIERFAALVAAAERESCAVICESKKVKADSYFEINEYLQECAYEIREGG